MIPSSFRFQPSKRPFRNEPSSFKKMELYFCHLFGQRSKLKLFPISKKRIPRSIRLAEISCRSSYIVSNINFHDTLISAVFPLSVRDFDYKKLFGCTKTVPASGSSLNQTMAIQSVSASCAFSFN